MSWIAASDCDTNETCEAGTSTIVAFARSAMNRWSAGGIALSSVPTRYQHGTEDKAIPPALQRFMAERANATIVEVPASHVSFVSQPDAATQLILQAVEATVPAASRT